MTSAELANELRIKESYLKSHWNRIISVNKKAGISLFKIGRGVNANYGIKSYEDEKIRWETK